MPGGIGNVQLGASLDELGLAADAFVRAKVPDVAAA